MIEWISKVGPNGGGPGSDGHVTCMALCSECIANKLASDPITIGVLTKDCIDNLCGPSFPGK
jgi:hypothetical protein